MREPTSTFTFLGMTFNVSNMVSITLACLLVFILVFALSRHITLKPGKAQNVLEYMVDFTNGIIKSTIPDGKGRQLGLWSFTIFFFILISNLQGLLFHVDVGGVVYVKSPTADPLVTMTLAAMTLLLAQFLGVQRLGYRNHFGNFLKPFKVFFVINFFEEFTNLLTLGLRLYGNIYSGEMLLGMITSAAVKGGLGTSIAMLPVEMVWQGFSVFVGCIQAYVFVTLSSVYISRKIEIEE
ncbi:F0F1 ATP synthase subunit A [Lentilactobacillus kribbianus]|uniref:F0F1 ATP synthase subunit A n=1 Tax=Lentilactobacillus kribbianus TaxID=2729622 RepID=UPI0015529D3D|nr:F0F1 ATP synthase subunit A [Lentilactobacillus kribbianus]